MGDKPNFENQKWRESVDALALNPYGLTPSDMGFMLTEQETRNILMKLAKDDIPEFEKATLEFNPNTGMAVGYVWISKHSNHLSDKTLINNTNAAYSAAIPRYSDVIQNFIKKYSPEGCKRVVPDADKNSDLCAVVIDLEKFFKVIFDKSGIYFKNAYGHMPVASELRVQPMCSNNRGEGRYGRLEAFHVTKEFKRAVTRRDPKPVSSFGQ